MRGRPGEKRRLLQFQGKCKLVTVTMDNSMEVLKTLKIEQ